MNIDLTEKWAKEIALMSDAEFEENCKHIETLLSKHKQALRIHDVSRSFTIKDLKKAFYGAKSLIPDGEIVSPKLVEEFKTFEEWYKENYD